MTLKNHVGLIEGECLDVMRQIPNNSVNLIICDLPYGTTQNKWDCLIPLADLWTHYSRILAPKGAVVLTSQGIFTARLILSKEDWFKYKIVWEKSKPTNFLNVKKQPLRKHEDICIFYPQQSKYFPQMSTGFAYNKGVRKDQQTGCYGTFRPSPVRSDGDRYPTDVIYHKTAESEGATFHPTQKPVGLARYLIRTYSAPGDTVLDNAFGSGSFLVAAAIEGRNAIGIELNRNVEAFKKQQIDLIAMAADRFSGIEHCDITIARRYDKGAIVSAISKSIITNLAAPLFDIQPEGALRGHYFYGGTREVIEA